jgi:hypothetical protein
MSKLTSILLRCSQLYTLAKDATPRVSDVGTQSNKTRGVDHHDDDPMRQDLTPWPPSPEPILPLCKAVHRHNPYPYRLFSQGLRHLTLPKSSTTCHDTVAGTYKRLSQAKHSAKLVWIPSSGLPVLTRSSHAPRKNKSAKEMDDSPMFLSALPPFPLVCLKV